MNLENIKKQITILNRNRVVIKNNDDYYISKRYHKLFGYKWFDNHQIFLCKKINEERYLKYIKKYNKKLLFHK